MGQRILSSNISQSSNTVEIYRGQSKTLQVTVTDDSCNPVDLTGATIFFTLKSLPSDPQPLFTKISTDNTQAAILVPPTNGVAQIFIMPIDTQYLDIGSYVFDVWVQLSSGKRFPVIPISEFNVIPGITTF